ncbi:5-dehydro-2-deoxygluconokinase [Chryseobacterium lactis]|uniref:5-dehydro-2-deoxygluconokinase n=1 Tax=Chryseobacterium lactis TaxID=1241981 RepID=A0A3G6RK99_CHRLC|nr:5-dehydro-2-deoxygluconokinase [Chryseobacterium lactis]AZA82084.1 5-dehydro-2-deoxygluconokinase [Chryseobacterium lactis]AZB02464.1 5-dehydro-2-deoxygluconokinase [Chryseobacterium lactis]PNW14240.1 5-dehydro-2-deoxygluconokinase [Chryseobacterium lactis]
MKFDLLTFGRASIDLYSKNIGAEFNDIKLLSTAIGGSPVNISVGAQRLGLKTSIVTGVGNDPIGSFIINALQQEKVDVSHVNTIEGTTSTAVVCGIVPPDKFPLVFYRDKAPDNYLSIDMVNTIDFTHYRSFLMTGTALSVEPTRSAAIYATEKARAQGATIFLDIDFRANLWHDVRAFGVTLRQYLPLCDIIMGTEEELLAMGLTESDQVKIKDNAISSPTIEGDINAVIKQVLSSGVKLLLVKTGAKGVSAYYPDGRIENIPGFPVEVVNVLGAGDAFASGFIYGYLQNWDTYQSCRLANACGAWIVTRQGCSNYAPTYEEIIQFIKDKGGF